MRRVTHERYISQSQRANCDLARRYVELNLSSRIQLAPHARRRAVPKTVSEWIPVVRLTGDEVAKSGRTGIMTAYTQNMLSRKRTLWTA